MQQVRPHHEEPLLDGNAQSVRYGEMIRDGSGQPGGAKRSSAKKTEKNVVSCRFW